MRTSRSSWAALLCATPGLIAIACSGSTTDAAQATERASVAVEADAGLAVATFAGGCFWCMESPFDSIAGVQGVVAGYTGGHEPDPTYEEVSSGTTGHAEAVQVRYDPRQVDYRTLLDAFWRQIDPRDAGGQFADRGSQYRTAIFFHDEEQKRLALESKADLERSGRFGGPIVTEILPASKFYPAEAYHQDYYETHPSEYKRYRQGSGREAFLDRAWKETPAPAAPQASRACPVPDEAELRQRLTPLQYHVTQDAGTERAFANEYWDNDRAGIYVDVVTGEPLFSSTDKYDSGTGWPSFTRPLVPENVVGALEGASTGSGAEVRSKGGDSHLGHVFDDGPKPAGLRYCINSAALRFVPAEDLEEEGYAEFRPLFDEEPAGK